MIHRQDRDGVAILRLAHGKANTLDLELFQALDRALEEIESDDGVRAVVLTGSGGIFSAGVDLYRVLDGGDEYLDAFVPAMPRTMGRLFLLPLPVIGAINGHAIAGGCILLAACDRVVAAEGNARIGVTELPVGVPFPVLALEILRHRVGDQATSRLVLDGGLHDPREALERGLVDEVVPAAELEDRAVAVARKLGAIARDAFAPTKRQLRRHALDTVERLADHDREVLAIWKDPATHERIRLFLERTVGKK